MATGYAHGAFHTFTLVSSLAISALGANQQRKIPRVHLLSLAAILHRGKQRCQSPLTQLMFVSFDTASDAFALRGLALIGCARPPPVTAWAEPYE